MHSHDKVDEETGKPGIMSLYNNTKGGVDTFEQLFDQKTLQGKQGDGH